VTDSAPPPIPSGDDVPLPEDTVAAVSGGVNLDQILEIFGHSGPYG
jgi:hypothetical protein